MYAHFRLTDYGNMADLGTAVDHLCSLNIPCGINAKTNKRTKKREYALWKIGKEITSGHSEVKEPNSERLSGEVVESYGDFRAIATKSEGG